MPLMDRKPINIDNDDEHHKNLMHRQGKNDWNNDTSKIFMFIPIGSTLVVQWGDGGLWTHGTVIGKGDHNHHSRSYKIQVTKAGRIITCNRQHIKPTPITAADFLHYHGNKHTKTDPLDAILDHILRHPLTPTDRTITYERSNNNNIPYEHKDTNSIQDIKGKQRKNVLTQYQTMNTKMMGKILWEPDMEGL